jgi:zinc protease
VQHLAGNSIRRGKPARRRWPCHYDGMLRLWIAVALVACASPPKPAAVAVKPPPPAPPAAPAKIDPDDLPVAVDPAVRVGKLPNGLTYYVLHHATPPHRAALWLAVNAGSVLEDDDQRGLAHFVEHMAFNGTKRFPKLDIVDYLEKNGMTFGADANAYTNFDQTVYQLTVPTDDRAVLLRGLDILRDMAGDVTFDPVEVDKERGVVLEEWRTRRGVAARVEEQRFPVLFAKSRYAERLTIGLPEVIKTAKRDTLYRFYKDWYRPDLMAVIVVGDFEAEVVEKEIQARFADLAKPAKPRERTQFPVPHDQPPAILIASDPEARSTTVTVYDKLDREQEETKRQYRQSLVERAYFEMMNWRLAELRDEIKSPVVTANAGRRGLTRTADAITHTVTAKDGQLDKAIALVFKEMARVNRHGFLASELERARKDMISRTQRVAREYEKAPLGQLAAEIVRNFTEREAMPGAARELEWVTELAPGITLDDVNALAHTGDRGRVITIIGPANVKLPSEAEVAAMVKIALDAPSTPWVDTTPDRPLVVNAPTPGKVVKTAHDAAADATVWTLSNGVRVVVKPTAFANDGVLVTGWKSGGTSLVPDKEYVHARFADEIVGQSGAAELSERGIRKLLAGKSLSVRVRLDELAEDVTVTARPEDLETAMQMMYLRLAQPTQDPGHRRYAFTIWKNKRLEAARRRDDSPEQRFSDEVISLATSAHPRRKPLTPEMIEQIDIDKVYAIYQDRLADFGNATFVFVGNLDLAELQPLVETYIGSLPTRPKHPHWRDIGIKHPPGKVERTIVAGSEPKSRVWLDWNDAAKWSFDAERDAYILAMVLRIRLREILREDMGGVYGVSVSAGLSREPTQRRDLRISFGCAPENVDKLVAAALAELDAIAKSGVADTYLAKVTEQLRRHHETDLTDNGWWLGEIRDAYYYGDDFAKSTDIDAMLRRVTSANLQATARRMYDGKRYARAVLVPTASPPPAPPSGQPSSPPGLSSPPAPAPVSNPPAAGSPGNTASHPGSASPRP